MANKDFIKLSRTFFDTPLWKNIDRPYTHAEAWLDLLSLFRVTNTTVTETFNRIPVTYGPNQVPVSMGMLAMRWRRDKMWTQRFLKELSDCHLITVENSQKVTLVTADVTANVTAKPAATKGVPKIGVTANVTTDATNDVTANVTAKPAATKGVPKIGVTANVTTDATNDVTDTYFNQDNIYNIINIKKPHTIVCGKEISQDSQDLNDFAAPAAIRTRAANFYNSLVPYVQTYGREMVRAFYDYWTEPNRSQTHMRYELERTWSLPLRLKTWAKREKQTNHNNHATDKYEQKRIDIALREARYMEDIKRLDEEYLARLQS